MGPFKYITFFRALSNSNDVLWIGWIISRSIALERLPFGSSINSASRARRRVVMRFFEFTEKQDGRGLLK